MFDFSAVYRQAAAHLNAVDSEYIRAVEQATDMLERSYRSGGNVLVSGNGGSSAHELGLRTVGLTGSSGGSMREHCNVLMAVAATETPRIQELHLVTDHAIGGAVEQRLFGGGRA